MLEQSIGKDTCTALNFRINLFEQHIDKLMFGKTKK